VIRQTRAAAAQVEALFEHYLARDRDGAARNLLRAVGEALDRIEADPLAGLPHPRPYPGMARWGYRWIKAGRYWFGHAVAADGVPVLTNVLYDAADLPERVEEADETIPVLRLGGRPG
jgi:plasmid stabilization system protein ParE